MLTLPQDMQHDKVECKEKEIILSGPPHAVMGYITLENEFDEPVFVPNLTLEKSSSRSVQSLPQASVALNTVFMARESRRQALSLSILPSTAPGTYQSAVKINGKTKPVTVVIQANLEIELIPNDIVFYGAVPGETTYKEILLANKGNIPVVVPNIKHNTTVDMDLICRNLALALRKDKNCGMQETLDLFIKGLKSDVASWAEISIKEAGTTVKPGETCMLHIGFTLPKDMQSQWLYEGDIRIIDRLLSYKIVPNPSLKKPAPKSKHRTKK